METPTANTNKYANSGLNQRYLFFPKSGAGFTLIELLVVISIIGLLASVVLVSLNSARAKARNAKRVADLSQIQKALELYYNDNNGYPNPGWGWRSECNAWGGFASDQVIPGLVPKYMSRFPSDPKMNKAGSQACYLYLSNGTDYKVLDHDIAPVESGFDYQAFPNFLDPTRDSGSDGCKVDGTGLWSWAIYSSGGVCW
ncbi:MAG: prepilin-type N-terminal cleavage/methylation domain-containing protein [Candidatus Doudnabacteria bacterium]|nr:prepilin-type N-terminal cleavage/methylation domain-containing protein [Candidatus Doudnabacteria bacterium]